MPCKAAEIVLTTTVWNRFWCMCKGTSIGDTIQRNTQALSPFITLLLVVVHVANNDRGHIFDVPFAHTLIAKPRRKPSVQTVDVLDLQAPPGTVGGREANGHKLEALHGVFIFDKTADDLQAID